MAVATDLNPGTSPFASLPADGEHGLHPVRAHRRGGAGRITRVGALALGMADRRGVLTSGMDADFAVWSVAHPNALVYEPMAPRLWQRVLGGAIMPGAEEAGP